MDQLTKEQYLNKLLVDQLTKEAHLNKFIKMVILTINISFINVQIGRILFCNRRQTAKENGYAPANYLKEIEPKLVKKLTKQKVFVPEKVMRKRKVKKKVMVQKQRGVKMELPPSSPRSPRRGKQRRQIRRHFTAHFDRDNVATRQIGLHNAYSKLTEMAALRRQNLEDAIKYYHFCYESDDIETWMKSKEKQMNTEENSKEGDIIHVIRKKLERFVTEMTANSGRLDDLNKLADELITNDHVYSTTVKRKQKEVNSRWEKLRRLKEIKDEELKEKHGVELFFHTCDEMKLWINDKDSAVTNDDVGRDLETVRALQRRHQGLERDLVAVGEKVQKLNEQAKKLVFEHPRQARQIKAKETEILGLLDGLKRKAKKRKTVLDDAYGQQGFLADARDLLSWASDMKYALNAGDEPNDLSSANDLMQEQKIIWDEIQTHTDRFERVIDYGLKLLVSNPRSHEVKDRLTALKKEKNSVNDCWKQRNDHFKQALDLQIFIRDSEQVDTVTASHEAFLSNDDFGESVEDVDRLLKQHEDFEKTLLAQEERVRLLVDSAIKLAKSGHKESEWVSHRCDEVAQRRENVKQVTAKRRNSLLQSQLLQNFRRDTNECGAWIVEKQQIATDESYKDPTNLQGKLQRHQAFEAEVAANKEGMNRINLVSFLSVGNLVIPQLHVVNTVRGTD